MFVIMGTTRSKRDRSGGGNMARGNGSLRLAGRTTRVGRGLWAIALACAALALLPAVAHAAQGTVSGGTLTYNAAAGETNTAVIAVQQKTAVATVYFVGDQNPNVTVTASAAQGCLPTSAALGLPKGYLCTVSIVTPVNSLVENLG